MSNELFKICPKCKEQKSTACFSKDKSTRLGLCVWCKSCKDKVRKKWYYKNMSKQREHEKRWIMKNLNRSREHKRNWYRRNKKKAAEYQRRRKEENPILYNSQRTERSIRRYARVKGCTIGALSEIRSFYEWVKTANFVKCAYCKKELKSAEDRQVDHIIPIAMGGAHQLRNLAPSCRRCNQSKNCRSVEDFMKDMDKG